MKNTLSYYNLYTFFAYQPELRYFNLGLNDNGRSDKTNLSKKLVLAACVLGRNFRKTTLEHLYIKITNDKDFNEIFKKHLDAEYFILKDNDTVSFSSQESRDFQYVQIEPKIRKTLHELSADSIISTQKPDCNEYFENLIYHYTLSENEFALKKALWDAAGFCFSIFEHSNANKYYSRLLEYILTEEEKFELVIKIADTYRNAGEWDEEMKILRKNNLTFSSKHFHLSILFRIASILRLKSDYHKSLKILYRIKVGISEKENNNLFLKIMLEIAKIKLNKGIYNEALTDCETLIQKNDKDIIHEALTCMGIILAKLGKYNESIKIHEHLFKIFESQRDKLKMAGALTDLGEGYVFTGKYEKALEMFEIALRISKRLNAQFNKANLIGNIGTICFIKNDYNSALRHFLKQQEIYRTLGNRAGIAQSYGMIGASLLSVGKYGSALKYFFRQLAIVKNIKKKQSKSVCLGNIGIVYSLLGKFEESLKYFKMQLLIDETIKNKNGIFRAAVNLGIQYYNLKKLNIAEKKFRSALVFADKTGQKVNMDLLLNYYSAVLFELGKYDEAIEISLQSIEYSKTVNNSLTLIQSSITYEKCMLFSSNPDRKFDETIDNISQLLDLESGEEEKALIHYELWKLKKLFKIECSHHRKKAIYYYELVYKNAPQFEFKDKLKELSNCL